MAASLLSTAGRAIKKALFRSQRPWSAAMPDFTDSRYLHCSPFGTQRR